MSKTAKFCLIVLVLLTLVVIGCSGNPALPPSPNADNNNQKNSSAGKALSGQETMRLTVYYATGDAANLVPEPREVAKNDHPLRTAIELLFTEPQNAKLVRVLPTNAVVKNIWVKDNTAYVDFNDKIKNNAGGSATEILIVASIVNTLTEFSEVQRVQIMVEGKKVESISGHVDVSEPLTRSEKIIKKSL